MVKFWTVLFSFTTKTSDLLTSLIVKTTLGYCNLLHFLWIFEMCSNLWDSLHLKFRHTWSIFTLTSWNINFLFTYSSSAVPQFSPCMLLSLSNWLTQLLKKKWKTKKSKRRKIIHFHLLADVYNFRIFILFILMILLFCKCV